MLGSLSLLVELGLSLFIKNVDFLLEKCVFETNSRVLHYVLKRELPFLKKNIDFSLEICVKERGGRLALQNGKPLSLIC